MTVQIQIGNVKIGGNAPLALIAGPCVIESPEIIEATAIALRRLAEKLNIGVIFKSSFDKANRSSHSSFRGPGFEEGLAILAQVRQKYGLPVITDVHETWQVEKVAQVLDAIQIPAFLARQTDLLVAAANSGLPVNVKKGQFMAPEDMKNVVAKMSSQPAFKGVMVCERGTTFGYHNLVVDMRSFPIMSSCGWPVIFDATHSVQLPSASGVYSGGDRHFIPPLARAAVAAGIDGLFMETHPYPQQALCDGPNQWPLEQLENLITGLLQIHELVRPLK